MSQPAWRRRVRESSRSIVMKRLLERTLSSQQVLRIALWVSVGINALGVLVFVPLAVGRPSPLLPVPFSPFLGGQVAYVIALFCGVYLWLARQPIVCRPLVVVGAFGKLGFFFLCVAYSAFGDVPGLVAISALPDLMLGIAFLWAVRERT